MIFFSILFIQYFTSPLRCLPSFVIAREVQRSLSLVDREVKFRIPTKKSISTTVGLGVRKKSKVEWCHRDSYPRPNRQRVSTSPTQPPAHHYFCTIRRAIFYSILSINLHLLSSPELKETLDRWGRRTSVFHQNEWRITRSHHTLHVSDKKTHKMLPTLTCRRCLQ